jgi:hypothetical protein
VVISAFFDSDPRLYTIDIALSPDGKQPDFRYTRQFDKTGKAPSAPPRDWFTGSGASVLLETVAK